jgi:CubicO group peptidase (beta-lactamase class C family)
MMKKNKTLLIAIISLVIISAVIYLSPYRYLVKGIRLTYLKGEKSANYLDWKDFDLRKMENNPDKIFIIPSKPNAKTNGLDKKLLDMLTKTNSGSYIVVKNDTIVSEHYFNGITDSSQTNSFSMAKTITTLLVQKAIQDKIIGSWDDKVIDYLPWLTGEFAKDITLRHLSTMTAGLDWDESYLSPFGVTAKAYYSNDVEAVMKTVAVTKKPGENFQYQSGATQLLGFVLKKALDKTGKYKSVSEFAQVNLWNKIGSEYPAFWSLDADNGKELTYCCFDATARDFAKLGQLVLHHGKSAWGESIIDSTFLDLAQKPFKSANYGHSFWIGEVDGITFPYFQGLKGQYIAIVKNENAVIVRTGNGIDKSHGMPVFDCIKTYVSEGVKLK